MANRFWVGGAASWDGTAGTKWATTSGGAGGAAIPTNADDVFLDAASGAVTVTIAAGNTDCKSLTCTGFTGTLAGSAAMSVFGNILLVAGMTFSYSGTITEAGTVAGIQITSAGKSWSALKFNGVGGDFTLQDALNLGGGTLTLNGGTLNTNGKQVDCGLVSANSGGTRALNLGASTVNVNGSGWTIAGTTFNAGTSTVNFTGTSQSVFISASISFWNISFENAGNGSILSGAGTFGNNFTINNSGTNRTGLRCTASFTVTGTFTMNGTNANTSRAAIAANTQGTPITITAGAISLTNADFRDITAAGAAIDWTGTSLGNEGGNTHITFTTPVTRFWVGNGGNWGDTAHWSTSTGGAGGASVPLVQDTAKIDALSFTLGSQTITVDVPALGAVDFTNATNSPTFSATSARSFYGSLTLISAMTFSFTIQVIFTGDANITITSAGKTFGASSFSIIPFGTITLADDLIVTNTISLSTNFSGTFDAGTANVQAAAVSLNATSGTVNLGTGIWSLTSTGNVWNYTAGTINAGSSTIKFTNTTATGKTFVGGNVVYNNFWYANGAGGATLTITGSNTFNDFKDDSTAAHSILFTAGTTTHVTTFTVTGNGAGNEISINSTTTAVHNLIKDGIGKIGRDYLNIQHSVATPAKTWYAGTHSINNQGVATAGSGWIFTDIPTAVMKDPIGMRGVVARAR